MKRTRLLIKPKLTPILNTPNADTTEAVISATKKSETVQEVRPPNGDRTSDQEKSTNEPVIANKISRLRRPKPILHSKAPTKPTEEARIIKETVQSTDKSEGYPTTNLTVNDVKSGVEITAIQNEETEFVGVPHKTIEPKDPRIDGAKQQEEVLRADVNEHQEVTTDRVEVDSQQQQAQPRRVAERRAAKKANEFRERLIASRRKFAKIKKPVDTSKLTMLDLIYYNPPGEPMKKKPTITPSSTAAAEKASEPVGDIQQSFEPELEDESTMGSLNGSKKGEDDEVVGPRVIVGPDGQIQIDEASLVIRRPNPEENKHKLKVTVEEAGKARYDSFKTKKMKKCTWTSSETSNFYQALTICGTDFTLMTRLFPSRSRQDLKNKFKREEKTNASLIDKAIHHPTQFEYTEHELNDISKDDPPTSSRRPRKPRQSASKKKGPKKKEQPADANDEDENPSDDDSEKGFRNGVIQDTTITRTRRKRARINYEELDGGSSKAPEVVEENTAAGNYVHLNEKGEASPQSTDLTRLITAGSAQPKLPMVPPGLEKGQLILYAPNSGEKKLHFFVVNKPTGDDTLGENQIATETENAGLTDTPENLNSVSSRMPDETGESSSDSQSKGRNIPQTEAQNEDQTHKFVKPTVMPKVVFKSRVKASLPADHNKRGMIMKRTLITVNKSYVNSSEGTSSRSREDFAGENHESQAISEAETTQNVVELSAGERVEADIKNIFRNDFQRIESQSMEQTSPNTVVKSPNRPKVVLPVRAIITRVVRPIGAPTKKGTLLSPVVVKKPNVG